MCGKLMTSVECPPPNLQSYKLLTRANVLESNLKANIDSFHTTAKHAIGKAIINASNNSPNHLIDAFHSTVMDLWSTC
jgi:hypothetical protein